MTKYLLDAERDAVIAGLQAGHSQMRVAADVGVGQTTVARIARAHGLGRRGKKRMDEARRRAIEEMVHAGYTNAQITRLLHCTARSVLRVRDDLMEARNG